MRPFPAVCLPSCRRSPLDCVCLALALACATAQGATNRLAVGFAEYSLSSNRLEVADIADPAAPLPVCHFDLAAIEPTSLSATNGVLRVEGESGSSEFDISDIFAPVLDAIAPVASAEADGLLLVACQTDGVRLYRSVEMGPPAPATHCLTDGPALAVAPFPGGFAVALGTRGYATYDLDEFGLVSLRRQWPLEAGAASAVTYDETAGQLLFDCEEGGLRTMSICPVGAAASPVGTRPVGAVLQTAPAAP